MDNLDIFYWYKILGKILPDRVRKSDVILITQFGSNDVFNGDTLQTSSVLKMTPSNFHLRKYTDV